MEVFVNTRKIEADYTSNEVRSYITGMGGHEISQGSGHFPDNREAKTPK